MAKGICPRCKSNPSLPYHCFCRKCHCERQKQYYGRYPRSTKASAARRSIVIKAFVDEAKNKPCSDCGIKYISYAMDFDHVRGNKKFNLSVAAQRKFKMQVIKDEIEKCDVVCANCHRIRTYKRILASGVKVAQRALTPLE